MLLIGTLAPEKRVEEWKRKRVFFLTPQVMQNDLTRSSCPAEQVVCVVFDEAHKALGNHAYCQVGLFKMCVPSSYMASLWACLGHQRSCCY